MDKTWLLIFFSFIISLVASFTFFVNESVFQVYYFLLAHCLFIVILFLVFRFRKKIFVGVTKKDLLVIAALFLTSFTICLFGSGIWDPFHSAANIHIEQVWSLGGYDADPYPGGQAVMLTYLYPFGIDAGSIHLLNIFLFSLSVGLSYLALRPRLAGLILSLYLILNPHLVYWAGTGENTSLFLLATVFLFVLMRVQNKKIGILLYLLLMFIPMIKIDFLLLLPLFVMLNPRYFFSALPLTIPSFLYLFFYSPYFISSVYAVSLELSFAGFFSILLTTFREFDLVIGGLFILAALVTGIRRKSSVPLIAVGMLFISFVIYLVTGRLNGDIFFEREYFTRLALPLLLTSFFGFSVFLKRVSMRLGIIIFFLLVIPPLVTFDLSGHQFQKYEARVTFDAVQAVVGARELGATKILDPFENHFSTIVRRETGDSEDIHCYSKDRDLEPNTFFIEPEFCWDDRWTLYFSEGGTQECDRVRSIRDAFDVEFIEEYGFVRLYRVY